MKRLLVTVCGRAGSKGFRNKNLKIFCENPLVHYTLSAIDLFLRNRLDIAADVVLNTDSAELARTVAHGYPEVRHIPRPESLAGDAVAKMRVFRHCLDVMEREKGEAYDCLLDLDITSPLRTARDVAGCAGALLDGGKALDVVMSAVKSRRSPYMNMARREGDTVEQVIKTRFVARQQAPVCYDLNASIYALRRNFLAENASGFLWDGRCDVYEMEDTGILDIDSEEDFLLMEVIARHLYATRPEFALVRDNIRV